MSFVLAVFHMIVFVVILMRNTVAAAFHDGCWFMKSLFVFAGFIVSMWIPVEFFLGYSVFARWVSAIFLVY